MSPRRVASTAQGCRRGRPASGCDTGRAGVWRASPRDSAGHRSAGRGGKEKDQAKEAPQRHQHLVVLHFKFGHREALSQAKAEAKAKAPGEERARKLQAPKKGAVAKKASAASGAASPQAASSPVAREAGPPVFEGGPRLQRVRVGSQRVRSGRQRAPTWRRHRAAPHHGHARR